MKKFLSFVFIVVLSFALLGIDRAFAATLYWPVPQSTKINAPYGEPRPEGAHKGIDIAPVTRGVPGDLIVAIHDGVVTSKMWDPNSKTGWGSYIIITHDKENQIYNSTVRSIYAHLSNVSSGIKVGDFVKGNTKIGEMGTSGHSTGVHLHFEMRPGTTGTNAVDPMRYFNHVPFTIKPLNNLLNNFYNDIEVGDFDDSSHYSYDELEKMTPEELIEIGYPNPYEFQ